MKVWIYLGLWLISCQCIHSFLQINSSNQFFSLTRKTNAKTTTELNARKKKVGIMLIDHGSRREEANQQLIQLAEQFKHISCDHSIVEPAHMELSEPSILTAFTKCVQQGAEIIICHPFFLSRGKHVQEDIPRLLTEASELHPDIEYRITNPIGLHVAIPSLIKDSVDSTYY